MKKILKISADYWITMSSNSNISVRQKIIISWYLSHHMGHPACAPKHKISKVGLLHVGFQKKAISVDSRKYGVKRVDCFRRDLSKIIRMHSGEIFQDVEDISNIEFLIGGYYGKGKMIYIAALILSFRTKNKNPKNLELQFGEVGSSKDTMELLSFIV